MNANTRPQKKIAIVVFSYYPHDLRIRRAAEAAIKRSYQVDLFCLKKAGQPKVEKTPGLTIYRLNVLRSRSKKINYIVEYLSFLASVFLRLSIKQLRERYGVIHVNNMPDVLVFAGLLAKINGARIILDLHDPMPEVFMTKYGVDEKSALVRMLVFLERASIRFSDRVITTNIAFRDLFVRRGCPPDKIQIVMNAPDDEMFALDHAVGADRNDPQRPFRVVFNGTIVERHGLDTAIDAVIKLKTKIPRIRFDIYGDGDYAERLFDRIVSLGAESPIRYHGFVHVAELANVIKDADVGVIPNRRSVFTEVNFPVRIFEYLIHQKPIIAPNTRGIRDYFAPEDLLMFSPGQADDLAERIFFVYANPEETKKIIQRGYAVYERHRWALQKEVLLKIYEDLFHKERSAPIAPSGGRLNDA